MQHTNVHIHVPQRAMQPVKWYFRPITDNHTVEAVTQIN